MAEVITHKRADSRSSVAVYEFVGDGAAQEIELGFTPSAWIAYSTSGATATVGQWCQGMGESYLLVSAFFAGTSLVNNGSSIVLTIPITLCGPSNVVYVVIHR